MLLHSLLRQFNPTLSIADIPDSQITGIQEDSRLITPGNLFVARTGTKAQGQQFLTDAAAKGAVAVVAETAILNSPLPVIRVPHAGEALSILANLFESDPSEHLKVIGITGTNGKTTITYLLRHLLATISKKTGIIGTVQIDDGATSVEASMTTPSAVDVASILSRMVANQCDACAIETSSHALDQGRVAGVHFAAAGFTNLTGDHLDYHKTMDQYAAAKAKVFEQLPPRAIAAVNADDPAHKRMTRDTAARVVTFGIKSPSNYHASDIRVTSTGTHFTLTTPKGSAAVDMVLIGRHNVENALLASSLVGELFGMTPVQIATGLKDALGAPGRLQPVRAGQPFAVLVDYAHTDDALDNVLSALRPLTAGTKLRVLFGCGGDRDTTKRPRMAKTAHKYADAIYVTSDNPRTEDPDKILTQIMTGFPADNSKSVYVDVDRRKAICRILTDAQPGDIILIAGKGHENYQIIGTTKHHFDDVEEAMQFLSRRTAAA